MHHFVAKMCTFVLQNGALWDMGVVHCGIICELGQCQASFNFTEYRSGLKLTVSIHSSDVVALIIRTMFCQKFIFGQVKCEKFSQCLFK